MTRPAGPWALAMRWHDLLFMHWRIDAAALRPKIPEGLAIDEFDGSAWIGVVPFRMTGVRPRLVPTLPWLSAFPELNVRTYVTPRKGAARDESARKPGVWFFSLDAARLLAVRVARAKFHLPYFHARMHCREQGEFVDYASKRIDRGAPPAEFRARYRATGSAGSIPAARAGSVEHFLTARMALYAADDRGTLFRGDIDHPPWPLQPAEATVECNTMLAAHGLATPAEPPLLHFVRRLDVVAWPLARC